MNPVNVLGRVLVGSGKALVAAMRWANLILIFRLMDGQPCSAQVVLNEVLYDPEGADGGQEFVELFNAGVADLALSGFRLEFANGAVGPQWQLRWSGGATDSLAAGSRFLIVDRNWTGQIPGQAEVSLSLQNGPDAVRLVRPDGTTDMLGYGEPLATELSEGSPHADVVSGQSLGRRPDGHDSDNNVADWVAMSQPTPGAVNFSRWAARVDWQQNEPPSLSRAGFLVVITLHLTNTGLSTLPASTLQLDTGIDQVSAWLEALPPDQSRTLQFHWLATRRGLYALTLTVPPGQGVPDLVLPLSPYQVGQEDIYLNEVMPAPLPGGCEWIEVGNEGPAAVNLGNLTIRDEDGDWHALPAVDLVPGKLVILVQDRDRFWQWWDENTTAGAMLSCPPDQLESAVHELATSWPSLNNTPPAERDFADRVFLGTAAGTVVDHVILGAYGGEIPAGRSLERIARIPSGDPQRNWQVATTSLGATPGCANSVSGLPPESDTFTLRPNPFQPTADGPGSVIHLLFELSAGESGWDARVYDLWGRPVRDLGGDRLGPGNRDVLWDGRDDSGNLISEGAYIVLLRTYNRQAQQILARKALAVIQRRSPP